MYLPSLSGDLRISNMTTRDTAKTVISNTTDPAMIRSFSLEMAWLHFMVDSFYKDCDSRYFSLPVYKEELQIKFDPADKQDKNAT